ncbi:MAG: putative sigma-54 modulation protein [Zhongshania aliphaticivorans]|jgi:putative sigma-54 modulation protein
MITEVFFKSSEGVGIIGLKVASTFENFVQKCAGFPLFSHVKALKSIGFIHPKPKKKEYIMEQHDVIISGLNMDLTEAIKNIIYEKVEKLFEHDDQIIRMRVELEYDSHRKTHEKEFIAKGHLEVRGNDHVAHAETDNLYKSIDGMVHKLDRMIRRRSKLQKVKRKDIHDIDIPIVIPKTA